MYTDNVIYIKIRKEIARRMYNEYCDITLLTCKTPSSCLYDNSMRHAVINKNTTPVSFDRITNAFMDEHCNAETGYYPCYYAKKEDYDRLVQNGNIPKASIKEVKRNADIS